MKARYEELQDEMRRNEEEKMLLERRIAEVEGATKVSLSGIRGMGRGLVRGVCGGNGIKCLQLSRYRTFSCRRIAVRIIHGVRALLWSHVLAAVVSLTTSLSLSSMSDSVCYEPARRRTSGSTAGVNQIVA